MLKRRLFWQVYLTLLASLVLVAVFGALIGHMMLARGARVSPRMIPRAVHMLMFLLVVCGAVAIAAYPMVARITRRLEALRKSVETWDVAGAQGRAAVDGRDEIAAVARSFNLAADRAESLLAAHKTLLANASHELRSPLTRLRMAAELFAKGGERRHLATLEQEITELDSLVEEILLASRLDHAGVRQGPLEVETVDVLALAAEEAARAGVVVAPAESGGPFEVAGSPRLLRRLVRNLIENAVKHGGAPVEVKVARSVGGAAIEVTVSDRGPGVAPNLRERVFEPFFRPAGSSETSGSWGLGLSLARQIARRHGGDVTCGAAADGSTLFSATLQTGASGVN